MGNISVSLPRGNEPANIEQIKIGRTYVINYLREAPPWWARRETIWKFVSQDYRKTNFEHQNS